MRAATAERSIFHRILWGSSPRRTLLRVCVLAITCWLLFRFAIPPLKVAGISMEPTFRDGSFRFGNLLKFRSREPAHGDIVAIRMTGTHAMYLKRVLAVPGDRISFQEGTLLVNGHAVPEPYVVLKGSWSMQEVLLAPDEYFVAGDNRSMAKETHKMGVVKRSKIAGGVL